MSVWVVDASVAVKWVLEEDRTDLALALREAPQSLIAPDLLHAETANAIWKKVQRKELTATAAREIHSTILRAPVVTIPSGFLVSLALDIAMRTGRSVYDCLYVSLAER